MLARRIPGTGYRAETVYVSGDRTVQTVRLWTDADECVGIVSLHGRSTYRSRGWHEGHGVYRNGAESWPTLADAAIALHARTLRGAP